MMMLLSLFVSSKERIILKGNSVKMVRIFYELKVDVYFMERSLNLLKDEINSLGISEQYVNLVLVNV